MLDRNLLASHDTVLGAHAPTHSRNSLALAQHIDAEVTLLLHTLKSLDPTWTLKARVEHGQSLWFLESNTTSRTLTFEYGSLSYRAGGGRYEEIAITESGSPDLARFLAGLGRVLQPGLPAALATPQAAKATVASFTVPKVYDSDYGAFVKRIDGIIATAGGGITRQLDRMNGQSFDWWGYADILVTLSGPREAVGLVERGVLASFAPPR